MRSAATGSINSASKQTGLPSFGANLRGTSRGTRPGSPLANGRVVTRTVPNAEPGPRPGLLEPVRRIPGDEELGPPTGTALCLSGGGYRAMLFHIGVLRRLNEAGLL